MVEIAASVWLMLVLGPAVLLIVVSLCEVVADAVADLGWLLLTLATVTGVLWVGCSLYDLW